MVLPRLLALPVVLLLVASASAQGPFVNFESPQSPHAVTVLGDRLYAVNTPDQRISVFDISAESGPVLLAEIPVALEPVALAARPGHPDEVWVVGHHSDDVSIVDVAAGAVVGSIPTPDEPADILFLPDGSRAYVSVSQANQVLSIDAATRTIDKTFDIPMEEPRALALSRNGRFLVIAVLESGNGTTILPAEEAPPSNPQVGILIPDNDPRSGVSLPDKDLWVIRTSQNKLMGKTVKGVGTINFAVGVDPATNRAYVANTEALNLVQFEPNLRGHAIDSRVTIVRKTPGGVSVDPVDLNPTIDYGVLPNPAARAIALSQPTAVEFDPDAGKVFVAAFGSARVAVLDRDGVVQNRIEVGAGPRALAFHAPRRHLYVLERLDNTITEIDSETETVVRTFPIGRDGFDPTPLVIRIGRPFLYDAGLSGNGTMSCASCHVDATWDHVAWDLGDPNGDPDPEFPPAKGPMVTQSLRDLATTEPYHWRGDRPEFTDFASAFESLLGNDAPLPDDDMQAFEDFIFTVKYPPNPLMNLDRTFSPEAQLGLNLFTNPALFGGQLSCATCHAFPFGETPVVIPGAVLNESQGFNPALLPGAYEKTGFERTGFAFLHDGSDPTIFDFLSTSPPFPPFTPMQKERMSKIVLEWDTGIAPAVGQRVFVDAANAGDAEVQQLVSDLAAEVPRVHADVVAHGLIDGTPRGLWFDPRAGAFVTDLSSDPAISLVELRNLAEAGRASVAITGVPVGSGPRIGIDRDDDTLRDGDEATLGTDPRDPDTDGDGHLDGVEVDAGSDPKDASSVPATTSSPAITGSAREAAAPWPSFERLVITGTDIRPGAVLEITAGAPPAELALFPVAAGRSAIFEPADASTGNPFAGWTVRVRNRDGGTSPAFALP